MLNWLAGDDALITVQPRTRSDLTLELTRSGLALVGFGFLLVLPLALAGRRRRHLVAATQGMKSKILLNLALIAALVALSLYAYFKPWQETAPSIRLIQLKRDDITRIAIEPRGATAIKLEKLDGAWRIVAPIHGAGRSPRRWTAWSTSPMPSPSKSFRTPTSASSI